MSKLLIVSNNALSLSDSNGRTLMNFLDGFMPNELAQFYIHGTPDESICKHYFQMSDQHALAALVPFSRKKASISSDSSHQSQINSNHSAPKRNCRNLVFRDIVWRSFRWWKKDFDDFISKFAPDVLLFQAGDCPFMFAIARRIARKWDIPLVMYNSEGYVLKRVLYSGVSSKSIWHFLLQKSLKGQYSKIMNCVKYCVYSTEYIEKCYQETYPHPNKSTTLYTVSNLLPLPDKSDVPFTLLYCGNLGVGRIHTLNEMATVLSQVDSSAQMNIYGKFVCDEDEKMLCSHSNVHYGGVVPYTQIPELMSKASLLIHCENPERVENLKHAFSTKIADCLASGRPFLVYASCEYPFIQYLNNNNAAHICENTTELSNVLSQCIENKEYLYSHTQAAVDTAHRYHDSKNNSMRFRAIIESLI